MNALKGLLPTGQVQNIFKSVTDKVRSPAELKAEAKRIADEKAAALKAELEKVEAQIREKAEKKKREADRAFGIKAIETALDTKLTEAQIATVAGLAGKQGGFVSTFVKMRDWFKSIGAWFASLSATQIAIGILVLAGLGVGIYFLVKATSTAPSTVEKAAESTAAKLNSLVSNAPAVAPAVTEGFQDAGARAASQAPAKMINAQPLTIKQAGYMGPIDGGSFKPEEGVAQALKAGFRSFVLQIDYLDREKDLKNFAQPNYPTLLYYDSAGKLVSANSGSIKEVAKTIAAAAFTAEVPNYTQPVILYLHVLRAPSPIRQKEFYIRYLSSIAKELAPLIPMHLNMNPLGIFTRQKNEATLLTAPMSSFSGNVIVLSNVDTSIFRETKGGLPYNPAEDLDYWVNMRVYLGSQYDTIGVTKLHDTPGSEAAVVVKLSDILKLSDTNADNFAERGKKRFVIALADNDANPAPEEVRRALNELGVNMLPLDIFGTAAADSVVALVGEYGNATYRLKPDAIQNISS